MIQNRRFCAFSDLGVGGGSIQRWRVGWLGWPKQDLVQ